MTAYYVQPEPSAAGGETYWLEGYAVGDAKFAAAQSDGTSTTLTAPNRVQLAGMLSEGEVTSLFGGNRVVAGALAQSPASATLTGVTRIRFGSIRADATSTMLLGVTRVRAPAYLTSADSEFDAGGNAAFYFGALTEAQSEVDAGVTRLRLGSVRSDGTSTSLTSAGRTRTQNGVVSVSQGTLIPAASVTYTSGALQEATSTVLASLSEKWVLLAEDTDDWTTLTTFVDPYVYDNYWLEGYTTLEDFDEYWTIQSEPTGTWTTLSPLT